MTDTDPPVESGLPSDPTVLEDLARRIGGPNSVTVPGFVISLGFTVLLGAAGSTVTGSGAAWLLPAAAGQVSAFAMLWIARRAVLRHVHVRPRPVRTLLCFAVAAAVGGGASGALAAAVSGRGGSNPSEAPPGGALALVAVLATITAFTLVASFSAVVVDAWREHRAWSSERQTLLDRLAYLRAEASDDMASHRQTHHEFVRNELERLVETIPATSLAELAVLLRRAATEVVRPLSHRLSTAPLSDIPATPPAPASLRQFARDLAAQPLVRPIVLSVLALIPGGLFIVLDSPAEAVPLVTVLAAVLLIGTGLLSAATAAPRRAVYRLAVWVVGLLALASAPLVLNRYLADDDDFSAAAFVWSYSILFFGLLGPTWHAGRAAVVSEARDRRMLMLAIERETAKVRQRERIEQDWLAKELHGRVQSTLLACTLRLSSQTSSTLDPHADEATRAWLLTTLTGLVADLERRLTRRSLVDGLADLRILWSELCQIEFDVASVSDDDLSAATSAALLRVVTELCTNSIVHGRARVLRLTVSRRDGHAVDVQLITDGTLEAGGASGLGSSILDELTMSWSVTAGAEGVVSRAVVPVALP